MLKARDKSIDFISGLLIIHMILGHCFMWANAKYCSFYSMMGYLYFFMPWFYFKSGAFYTCKQFSDRLSSGTKKFVKPFIIWSVVGFVMFCLLNYLKGTFAFCQMLTTSFMELLKEGSILGNRPLWFLLSLYVVLMLADLMHKYSINPIYVIVFCVCISIILHFIGFKRPYYISNVITGLCFLYIGERFKVFAIQELGVLSMSRSLFHFLLFFLYAC